jgi:DNA polymerase-3 subunit epsilon
LFSKSSEQVGHQMPDRTVMLEMDITPEVAHRGVGPIVIVASNAGGEEARKLYRAELARAGVENPRLGARAQVLDTLVLAREKYPGQRNSLDALCKRLEVDNSHRGLHGALLDANLLADVYLALTAGQGALGFGEDAGQDTGVTTVELHIVVRPRVLRALDAEVVMHEARIAAIDKASRGACVWKRLEAEAMPLAAQAG